MRKGWIFILWLGTAFLFQAAVSTAQPNLTFKRITVNWPTIELYFAVGCEGQPAYHMTKQDFLIRENGEEINDFTLWCPDPLLRGANAVSLVVDVSGSMRGEGLAAAKRITELWFNIMDPGIDEAALISAGTTPTVEQPMTTDVAALQAAAEKLRIRGNTAFINGISSGMEHLVRHAVNPCRAVILFSDGRDNISNMTVAEVIAQANRERLRVFTIGVGSVVDPMPLEMIAVLTGGYYYENPTPGQMVALYQNLNCMMHYGFQECVITYEHSGCADGSKRTVDLKLRNICDGEDMKSRTYRAALDTTDFMRQQLRIGTTVSEPADVVSVPLLLDWLPPDSLLHPFATTIIALDPRRPFLDARIPRGSPLEGAPLNLRIFPDSVQLELTDPHPVRTAGTLLELHIGTAGVFDSAFFPLQALYRPTSQRCLVNFVQPGGYTIAPNLQPTITPAGEVMICADGVDLTANDGFHSYRWSTGDSTRTIHVVQAGHYYVDVVNARNDTLRSPATAVNRYPGRNIRIHAQGPLSVCNGETVWLEVEGEIGDEDVYWNGRWKGRELEVGSSGMYWAEILDSNGCRHSSDTVRVTIRRPEVDLNVPTNNLVCTNDTLELRVLQSYPEYHWSTGDTTQSIRIVPIPERFARNVIVWVRDENGCRSNDRYIFVNARRERDLHLQPADRVMLCGDGEATVSPVEDFASWKWTTGDSTRSLTIHAPGTYALTATDSNGCSVSATVVASRFDSSVSPVIRAQGFRLCAGESIVLDGGEEYAAWHWSTGDSTRFLLVDTPGSYYADVTAFGGCTQRTDTVTIREESVPEISITMDGDGVICAGDSLLLSAPAGYAQYYWSTGETAPSIFVHSSGRYAVSVISAGGCENTSPSVHVTVDEERTPHIVNWGDFLFTNTEAVTYQWYVDGTPIPGETSTSMHATRSGRYFVEITDSCGRVLRSDEVFVTVTTAARFSAGIPRIEVFPDPAVDVLNLHVRGWKAPMQVELYDLLGRRKRTRRLERSGSHSIDISALPRGVYLLRLTHGGGVVLRRIVVE